MMAASLLVLLAWLSVTASPVSQGSVKTEKLSRSGLLLPSLRLKLNLCLP